MNIAKNDMGTKRKLVIAMLLPLLTSCATYKSEFSCGDAKGASCRSMDNVGLMIKSGEIDRFTDASRKKCRGRKCHQDKSDAIYAPSLREGGNDLPILHAATKNAKLEN